MNPNSINDNDKTTNNTLFGYWYIEWKNQWYTNGGNDTSKGTNRIPQVLHGMNNNSKGTNWFHIMNITFDSWCFTQWIIGLTSDLWYFIQFIIELISYLSFSVSLSPIHSIIMIHSFWTKKNGFEGGLWIQYLIVVFYSSFLASICPISSIFLFGKCFLWQKGSIFTRRCNT